MPSKRLQKGSSDSDNIEVLTFDQFVSSAPSSQKHAAVDVNSENTGSASGISDANNYDITDVEQPSRDVRDVRDDVPFASRRRLYLMVLADFGLSFTWLCKFAVATYVSPNSPLKASSSCTKLDDSIWCLLAKF